MSSLLGLGAAVLLGLDWFRGPNYHTELGVIILFLAAIWSAIKEQKGRDNG